MAEAIISSPKWEYALKNLITMEDGRETTPFRKLIKRMPGIEKEQHILYNALYYYNATIMTIIDVAELVLRKCTVSNAKNISIRPDSKEYEVTFDYKFIEDKEIAKTYDIMLYLATHTSVSYRIIVFKTNRRRT